MMEERKQILEMLAQGKITAEDAERLLDKLGEAPVDDFSASPSPGDDRPFNPKYLRVHVDSHDGDKINVRVPLKLIKTGLVMAAVLPDDVCDKLGDNGIDLVKLGQLEGDELTEAIRDLQVDVDSGDGDTIRVFCE
jgi:hypothetical protein